jgi:hypothetical protein
MNICNSLPLHPSNSSTVSKGNPWETSLPISTYASGCWNPVPTSPLFHAHLPKLPMAHTSQHCSAVTSSLFRDCFLPLHMPSHPVPLLTLCTSTSCFGIASAEACLPACASKPHSLSSRVPVLSSKCLCLIKISIET